MLNSSLLLSDTKGLYISLSIKLLIQCMEATQ